MGKLEFWVSNISPLNVTLADLAINIKAFSSINLLDNKHHQYTLEQLLKSKESGSIFNKRDKIKIREVAPLQKKTTIPINKEAYLPNKPRSLVKINQSEYNEINDQLEGEERHKLDEALAAANADIELGEE